MERIKASEFKARCLAIMDQVSRTGESVVITKKGRPVSRLVPVVEVKAPFGLHRGITHLNAKDANLFGTDEAWEAEDAAS